MDEQRGKQKGQQVGVGVEERERELASCDGWDFWAVKRAKCGVGLRR